MQEAGPVERALDALNKAGHSIGADGGIPAGPWSAALGGGGGGPGLDGCHYTNGSGCPCHHLNGGPCLFNVQTDPYEHHDLSRTASMKPVYERLLKRFREM